MSAVCVADTIEANVSEAHDQVEQGREQLKRAIEYQASGSFYITTDMLSLHHKVHVKLFVD